MVLTIDLEMDAVKLWNRCRGIVIHKGEEHGTTANMLTEIECAGFVLETYASCPFTDGRARVAGLCLRRCSDINIAKHAPAIPKRHNSNGLRIEMSYRRRPKLRSVAYQKTIQSISPKRSD